jgi:hypothetical protein
MRPSPQNFKKLQSLPQITQPFHLTPLHQDFMFKSTEK